MPQLTKLKRQCIQKFFYKILPDLNKITQKRIFRQIFGKTIRDLGIEKTYELFIEMFEDGHYEVIASDLENFAVYNYNKKTKKLKIIYEVNEEGL